MANFRVRLGAVFVGTECIRYHHKMTLEFEQLKNDPDLESERGPGGTLIFLDGGAYCVVGPEFVSTEESDCYAFGETRERAITNYLAKMADKKIIR